MRYALPSVDRNLRSTGSGTTPPVTDSGSGFGAILTILVIALMTMGFSCDGNRRPEERGPTKPPADLRLMVLTDPKGYLEPCGCQMRPLGGLDKLATVLAEARAGKVPLLVVAAGDIAFGSVLRPEDADGARQQELWRADTFVDIWGALGVSGVVPGPADLGQAPDVLAGVVTRSKFPWLVENASAAPEGLVKARLVDAGPVKVGLLGLVAQTPALRLPADIALDPDLGARASQAAAALRAQGAKLVVALVSGDRKSARDVAAAGVDVVVLGGVDQEKPLTPVVLEKGIVINAGYQGQRVLTLDLALNASGPWHDASEWTLREAQKDLEHQIEELRVKIAAWAKDPNVQAADLAGQRDRLETLESERRAKTNPSYTGRWFSAAITELAPEVRDDPKIAGKIDAYDKQVNKHNQTSLADRMPLPVKEGQAAYAGSESCQGCHAEAYAWWKNTKHGRAYATLENVHKEFNLSCVGCHVTGYNQPGGSTVTHVDKLKDVGCENCHGPGSLHNAHPETPGLVARDTPEAVCVSCHNHEHSDRFVYDAFKSLLKAPGHGLPAKVAH
jgi:2',3'-cyclic-nucleotide 2'-phosphodiesterase (5'-nucleotidase family)